MNVFTRWWDQLAFWLQLLLIDAALIVGALIAAKIVAAVVRGVLRKRGFDEYLRHPWTTLQTPRPTKPSDLAAYLCAGSVWGWALWWIAALDGFPGMAGFLEKTLKTVWIFALVIFAGALLGGWLARAVYALLQSPWLRERLDARAPTADPRGESCSQAVGRTVGIMIYIIAFLLALILVAELFRMASLAQTAHAVWEFGLRLFTALAVLGVGWLGVSWAQAQSGAVGEGGPAGDRTREYVGLGIIAGAVLFAIVFIAGSASLPVGFFVVLLIALALWPLRGSLTDLWAGLLLKLQQVKRVTLEGVAADVRFVGPLMTELIREGEVLVRNNREVLAAALKAAKATLPLARKKPPAPPEDSTP